MARDTTDPTPIESRDELVAYLEAGCKPEADFRIGTEHEKFGFYVDGHRPVLARGGVRRQADGLYGEAR
jgi:glutamate--cysteine ligase